MPVSFSRLRIAGFKSFAEPATVEIRPGLTGIVGPNGCGKSNVVEALRWCMGESSARSLRGGEMDDLIFAGTAARPARSHAEVSLTLDGTEGAVPPPFGALAELQIDRRLERGAGSAYRVNGREQRARDVQTLFADLNSGARSSGMVSQNRVSALVNARPDERRAVLEEAAGITGLHARRHEAELKLRATETNLGRAEDLRQQLEGVVRSLGAQSEQARRYREIASALRDAESSLLALLHARARLAVERTGEARRNAAAALVLAERAAAEADRAAEAAEAGLPAPREEEALARALLERRRVEAEGAEAEVERLRAAFQASEARVEQAAADHSAAAARLEDARDATGRLEAEREALVEARASLPARQAAAVERRRTLDIRVAEAAAALEDARIAVEEGRRHRDDARRVRDEAAARLEEAAARAGMARAERDALRDRRPSADTLEAALAARANSARMLAEAAKRLEDANATLSTAQRRDDAAQADARAAAERRENVATALRSAEAAAGRATSALVELRGRDAAARDALPDPDIVADAERGARQAAAEAEKALEAAEDAVRRREAAHAARLEAEARHRDAERERAARESALRDATIRLERADKALHAAQAGLRDAKGALLPPDQLDQAAEAERLAERTLAEARRDEQAAEEASRLASRAAAEADAALAEAQARIGGLEAEADGLGRLLGIGPDGAPATAGQAGVATGGGAPSRAPPVVDGSPGTVPEDGIGTTPANSDLLDVAAAIRGPAELDLAVATLFGEGLDAAVSIAAAPPSADAGRAFLLLPPADPAPLPEGATPLARLVDAPPALARALEACGVLDAAGDGDRLQPMLRPGQVLVDRAGALWRWDGFRVAAGQPNGAAVKLQQRRRWRFLQDALAEARLALDVVDAARDEAAARRTEADTALSRCRAARPPAELALLTARKRHAELAQQDAAARARIGARQPQHDDALAAQDAAARAHEEARNALAALAEREGDAPARDAARTAEQAAAVEAEAARQRQRACDAARDAARTRAEQLAGRDRDARGALDTLQPLIERALADEQAARLALDAARNAHAAVPDPAGAAEAAEAASDAVHAAAKAQADARAARAAAEIADRAAREAAERVERTALEVDTRLAVAEPRAAETEAERDAAAARLDAAERALHALPDLAAGEHALAEAAAALDSLRNAQNDALQDQAALRAEEASLQARAAPLESGLAEWAGRLRDAAADHEETERRLRAAQAEWDRAALTPDALVERLDAAARAVAAAMARHAEAAGASEAAATRQRDAHAARDATARALNNAREALLRAEGREEQARGVMATLLAEHGEQAGEAPRDLSDNAEAALRRRTASLAAERDALGPVNLRAEIELQDADQRMAHISKESAELETAINRLRGEVGQLNREGRERLMAVYAEVDRHFQSLFSRMFNGGRAHLGMVGSDDPLEAGLEIYAQPPGKKLSTLSLLSGGEQALTALSLIFAVFRCNPAPVCVLDEVDAPLDDANVERFCALITDMAREGGTRFLVVTHHQLTMANMDRLYGVTMQERGVSRVLSVDLEAASAMAG
ncbi:AAA family ATPase [Rhizosaccharibacter radicis]|uniref:Chromosome partition protein Smc n=1 Tax=Rhizosaccharibacter radicis TaxID=2782605 RepID=A0ABT1VV21_9PROT|nr:AAA family ATPase [Acetobacteraceae bacterium KSS12]